MEKLVSGFIWTYQEKETWRGFCAKYVTAIQMSVIETKLSTGNPLDGMDKSV